MALSKKHSTSIEATIRESLRKKFQTYKPESQNMPFHHRLLGKICTLNHHNLKCFFICLPLTTIALPTCLAQGY